MAARRSFKAERNRRRSVKRRVHAQEDAQADRRKLKVIIRGVEYAMTPPEYRAWAKQGGRKSPKFLASFQVKDSSMSDRLDSDPNWRRKRAEWKASTLAAEMLGDYLVCHQDEHSPEERVAMETLAKALEKGFFPIPPRPYTPTPNSRSQSKAKAKDHSQPLFATKERRIAHQTHAAGQPNHYGSSGRSALPPAPAHAATVPPWEGERWCDPAWEQAAAK